MSDRRGHILLAGVSTRALAESAARAGYRVTVVDAFGDLDLRAVADVVPLHHKGARPYGAATAARAASRVSAELVAYTSNFENHPAAVAVLSRGRRLLGNPPEVLARVRNPLALARALAAAGVAVPITRASAPTPSLDARRWLLKPRRSGGGHGTRAWSRGQPVPRGAYLQEWIAGPPGSIIFVADGRRAVTLGLTRQLVGHRAFGSQGFRYCGSLLAARKTALFVRQGELHARAVALADAVTAGFGLRGLNGIDFIARNGVPYPIEVNPRYSASMELVERATGLSLFRAHLDACAGTLPEAPEPSVRVCGKAIVFARHDVLVGDPARWKAEIADVPHPGERIAAGRPICTVFAHAADGDRCTTALAAAADAVYHATARRARGAA
jgi:predicted ATP-grasp superfamily ATP-dependent carboligase